MKKEIIILSGFLGSGKTTVLQNLIRASKDKKIAILLNDFGDTPVDGTLIENDKGNAPVVEIGGGSVFCSCLKEAFVKALFSLSQSDAERVLVEASGMSDPSGVTRMLALAKLDEYYEEALVICLFDPQRSLKLAHVLEVIPRQILAANVVVLTKSDVSSEEERQKSRDYIRSVNPNIPILESSNGMLDLESVPTAATALTSLFSFNTPETRLDTFTIKEPISNMEALLKILNESDVLLRVKGYVKTDLGTMFITDGPQGVTAQVAPTTPVPLTVICMQNKGKVLHEQIKELL